MKITALMEISKRIAEINPMTATSTFQTINQLKAEMILALTAIDEEIEALRTWQRVREETEGRGRP